MHGASGLRCSEQDVFDRASLDLRGALPRRTVSASDIPPLTGEEVRVVIGSRGMSRGEGDVQGSWRPRYGRAVRLDRMETDATCVPRQVQVNE